MLKQNSKIHLPTCLHGPPESNSWINVDQTKIYLNVSIFKCFGPDLHGLEPDTPFYTALRGGEKIEVVT